MKFVNLGNTELKVTDFCLGTMTWGEQTDEVDAHKQIEMSLDAGINFIDTAEMYPVCPLRAETTGDTEKILGNWLGKNSQKRKELVIATKISGKGYKNVRNGKGIFPKEIRLAIEGSLKNLQTDYIDLYQLHWPNRGSYHFRQYWNYDPTSQESSVERENIELVVKELYDLKKEGKLDILGYLMRQPGERCSLPTKQKNIMTSQLHQYRMNIAYFVEYLIRTWLKHVFMKISSF